MKNSLCKIRFFMAMFFLLLPSAYLCAAEQLDQDIQAFKKDLLQINKRLFILEEELLFPANTQLILLVSLDIGEFFTPDGITVKLDGKVLQSHLYTKKEVLALEKGAIQRLLTANIKIGKHELTTLVSGFGKNGKEYKRGATLAFEKAAGQQFVQLQIIDNAAKQQPEFEFKTWK